MQPTIVLNTLFDLWNSKPEVFNALPELHFVPPLAATLKAKGCSCGMAGDITDATNKLNALVVALNGEQVARFKAVLQRDPLIFGIQTPTGFSTQSY